MKRRENIFLILNILDIVSRERKLNYIAALHPAVTDDILRVKCAPRGFTMGQFKSFTFIENNNVRLYLIRDAFVDVVESSDLILGLSGAGNEQAAGLGKPVISFIGTGPQTTYRRMAEQERLLGGFDEICL